MNLIGKKESRWHQLQIDKYQEDLYCLKIIHLDNLLLYLSSNNPGQILDLLNSKWSSVSRSGNSSFSGLRNNPFCVTTDQRTIYFLENNHTLHSLTLKKNHHPFMDIDWILECKSTNKNLPPFRNNCTIEYFNDCIYIFGGTDNDRPRDELFIYDLKKECYFQFGLTDIKPEARHSHSSLLYNEKMFIFGGVGENRTYLYDLWEWDMKTNNGWKKIFPRHHQGLFPFPRSFSLIHAFDNMIFICKGKSKEGICEDLLCYNITSGRWEDLTLEENFPLDGDLNLFTVHNKNLIVGKGRELYQIDLNLILKGTKVSSLKKNLLDSVDSIAEDQISEQMKPSYKEIYNKKEFTDIVFRVEGQEFKAHKAVLAGRSKYFKNVFASGMSESQNQIVDVPNIKASIFKAILEFIYCDETRITEETALDLLKLASEYALDKLKMECEIVLVNSLKLNSAIDTANTADAHEAAYLKERTLDFIQSNIDRINEVDDITRLKRNLLLDLLKKQKN